VADSSEPATTSADVNGAANAARPARHTGGFSLDSLLQVKEQQLKQLMKAVDAANGGVDCKPPAHCSAPSADGMTANEPSTSPDSRESAQSPPPAGNTVLLNGASHLLFDPTFLAQQAAAVFFKQAAQAVAAHQQMQHDSPLNLTSSGGANDLAAMMQSGFTSPTPSSITAGNGGSSGAAHDRSFQVHNCAV
jgi:hypothetical protein